MTQWFDDKAAAAEAAATLIREGFRIVAEPAPYDQVTLEVRDEDAPKNRLRQLAPADRRFRVTVKAEADGLGETVHTVEAQTAAGARLDAVEERWGLDHENGGGCHLLMDGHPFTAEVTEVSDAG